MSDCRAPTARRTPISRVRSRMLASMMFMIPIPPDQQRNGGDRHHDGIEQPLGALLFGQQFGGNDHAEISGGVMRRIENRPHQLRDRTHIGASRMLR